MVLEIPTTKTEKTSPKTFQSIRSHLTGIKKKKSNRESQTNPLAISTFYSSKTGPSRGPSNSGPFSTKYLYKLPFIQNANHPRDQVSAPTRILDHFGRSQGWLLAYSSSAKQKTLSGVQIQGSGLAVSGNAVRPECCPSHIHQGDVTRSERTCQGRYMVSALSGRFTNSCTDKRGMPSSFSKSFSNHQQLGLAHKRKEVTPHSSSGVRVVGHKMGSTFIHSSSGRKKVPMSSGRLGINHHLSVLYQENSDESTRPLQLDRPERPHYSPSHVYDKNNSQIPLKSTSRCTHPNSEEPENASLRLGRGKSISTTSGFPGTRSDNSDRCLSARLGLSNKSNSFQRHFRPVNEVLHQRQGIANHSLRTPDYLGYEYCNPGTLRQLVSTTGVEKRWLHDIPSVLPSRIDMEESSNLQLDTKGLSHSGDLQCPRRPTVQEHSTVHRMVSHRTGLSESPRIESTVRSGSLCDETEQQTTGFCVALSGPNSSSSECTNNPLGQVGSSLHVSTDTFTFEGFVPTDPILLCKRGASHTGNAHETVVHGPSVTGSTFSTPRSPTSPSSSGQNSDSTPHYQTSRVAVIRTAYQSKYHSDQQTIGLLASPIRQSSLGDYEIKWRKFCSFLAEHKITPSQLSLANVLDFFSYLFFDKKLRPSTIAHYRSALTVPLRLKFKIDLHDLAVSHLIRAMYIQRPNVPASAPAWSLNKVLQLLDSWPDKVPLEGLLQKNSISFTAGYRLEN